MKNRINIIITIALSITTLGFAFLWIRTYFCADINHDSLEKLYRRCNKRNICVCRVRCSFVVRFNAEKDQ